MMMRVYSNGTSYRRWPSITVRSPEHSLSKTQHEDAGDDDNDNDDDDDVPVTSLRQTIDGVDQRQSVALGCTSPRAEYRQGNIALQIMM